MTDLHVVGLVLLSPIVLMVVEAFAYVPAGFDSAFWALPLAAKLDRIASGRRSWLLMARVWIAIPLAAGAGIVGAAAVGVGSVPWVWTGAGLAILAASAALVMMAIQGPTGAATRSRSDGSAPDWLEALWLALYDLERTWVLAMSAASVLIGIGVLDGGILAAWVGWALVGGPAFVAVAAVASGSFFPHMGLVGPILLGVGALLS